MRYTKAIKAEQKRLVEEMTAFLISLGTRIEPDLYLGYQMVLDTNVGPYYMTLYPGDSANDLGWIAGKFDDLTEPLKVLGSSDCNGINPFSGKWNHYFFYPHTVETSIEMMKFNLNQIM